MENAENVSMVARIRRQIELECQALSHLRNCPAMTAPHNIIQHKYNAIGAYQDQLTQLVGEKEATEIMVGTYIKVMG
jgi:hypothetical protein